MKSILASLIASLLFCLPLPILAQWERQYPLKKLDPVFDIALHEDDFGFAAGNNDLILRLNKTTGKWDLLDNWEKGWVFKIGRAHV